MKYSKQLIAAVLILGFTTQSEAQLLKKLQKKAENKIESEAEKRSEKRINNGIDKVFDGVEEEIDETVEGNPEKEKEVSSEKEKSNSHPEPSTNQKNESIDVMKQEPTLTWNKFDFVPGTEIIFEDNQEGEQNGEFPSKWDLSGGTIENAFFDGSNVIMFRRNNINGNDGIVPLLKNRKEDYLPEEFTIEFDAYFPKHFNTYRIYLFDPKNQKNIDPTVNANKRFYLRFDQNSANGTNISTSYYPETDQATNKGPGWRHISISFNKRALKAYIDDARLLNIPNMEINPLGICIAFHNPSDNNNGYIKNVRMAKGAVPLYDKFLTDGKFVTTGIKFDVNKATIKPESMGTINYVVKMMQDHPELNFSVEGHTDSDGDEESNQKLSEARAKAVLDIMVKAGISEDRLRSKGYGESKPMTDNATSEGKAQNRRVEFVKI